MYDTLSIRWDILSDPNFPVEYDGQLPNYASLPADSFPLVRYDGDLTSWFWIGRGVLVVTGYFAPGPGFYWDGIVLAGELERIRAFYQPIVNGTLVVGLNDQQGNVDVQSGTYQYHSCNVYAANRALSYLERVEHAVFEAN